VQPAGNVHTCSECRALSKLQQLMRRCADERSGPKRGEQQVCRGCCVLLVLHSSATGTGGQATSKARYASQSAILKLPFCLPLLPLRKHGNAAQHLRCKMTRANREAWVRYLQHWRGWWASDVRHPTPKCVCKESLPHPSQVALLITAQAAARAGPLKYFLYTLTPGCFH